MIRRLAQHQVRPLTGLRRRRRPGAVVGGGEGRRVVVDATVRGRGRRDHVHRDLLTRGERLRAAGQQLAARSTGDRTVRAVRALRPGDRARRATGQRIVDRRPGRRPRPVVVQRDHEPDLLTGVHRRQMIGRLRQHQVRLQTRSRSRRLAGAGIGAGEGRRVVVLATRRERRRRGEVHRDRRADRQRLWPTVQHLASVSTRQRAGRRGTALRRDRPMHRRRGRRTAAARQRIVDLHATRCALPIAGQVDREPDRAARAHRRRLIRRLRDREVRGRDDEALRCRAVARRNGIVRRSTGIQICGCEAVPPDGQHP